jgi:hypothetical protein
MLSLRRRRKANQLMAMLFLFIVTALLVNIKLQKRNFKSTKVHENRTALDSKLNIWLAGAGANIDPGKKRSEFILLREESAYFLILCSHIISIAYYMYFLKPTRQTYVRG